MAFDLRGAINAISGVVQNRPPPLREFDQIYMKVADMVIQAEYVARVFDKKNVVFVGDGDGIALSAAHLKAEKVIEYGPHSITLLDFDERIVNSVRRFAEKLADIVTVEADLYNVHGKFVLTPARASGRSFLSCASNRRRGGYGRRACA